MKQSSTIEKGIINQAPIIENEIAIVAPTIPSNFGIYILYSPSPNIDFRIEYKVP